MDPSTGDTPLALINAGKWLAALIKVGETAPWDDFSTILINAGNFGPCR